MTEQIVLSNSVSLRVKKTHSVFFSGSKMSDNSEDTASYVDGPTVANITRLDKATPPLSGTFSAGIYGGVAEGSAQIRICFSLRQKICAQCCFSMQR